MSLANVTILTVSPPAVPTFTASGETAILSIIFCNTGAIDRNITVYAYPAAGSLSATTMIINSLLIPANDTYVWTGDSKLILDNGDFVQCVGSGTGISATISYKTLT